jgi:hypothetical protein
MVWCITYWANPVLIAIKKGIVCQEVFKREKVELIAEQINITDTKSLIIVSAYRPPSKTDIDYLHQMISSSNSVDGNTSEDRTFLFNHVSFPMIMSGLDVCFFISWWRRRFGR